MFEVSDKYFGLNLNINWSLNLTQSHFWPTKLTFYSKTCNIGIYWLLHQTQKIIYIGIGIWDKWKCLWKNISHSNIWKVPWLLFFSRFIYYSKFGNVLKFLMMGLLVKNMKRVFKYFVTGFVFQKGLQLKQMR